LIIFINFLEKLIKKSKLGLSYITNPFVFLYENCLDVLKLDASTPTLFGFPVGGK
jgi:hypothetical protein